MQFNLLGSRKFYPLFYTQFLGAFNDNVFRNALAILLLYESKKELGIEGSLMITIAAGIFILPFLLFSAFAGQFGDKYDKSIMIQLIKMVEVVLMLLAVYGFMHIKLVLLLVLLFCMGTHSAFFGPLKYSILPDHLKQSKIMSATGLVEMSTFLAILFGTIIGAYLITIPVGLEFISILVLMNAAIGYLVSKLIPETIPAYPKLKIDWNIFYVIGSLLKTAYRHKKIFDALMSISWFWFLGTIFLTQMPVFVKEVIHEAPKMVSLFLAIFSIGIGVGSLLCQSLTRGEVTIKFVWPSLLVMSLFIADFSIISYFYKVEGFYLIRVMIDFFVVSILGGIYVVPLYALMQIESPHEKRSQLIAANNVMNALFMVLATALSYLILLSGLSVLVIFLTVAVLNLIVAGLLVSRS